MVQVSQDPQFQEQQQEYQVAQQFKEDDQAWIQHRDFTAKGKIKSD